MITTPNANKIWQLYTGKIKSIVGTGECFLGFSHTKPNADGSNFSEPDPSLYPSYERIQLNINQAMAWTDKFGDVANGSVSNKYEICTRQCKESGGWPQFTHFGIFDAAKDGNLLAFDLLTDPDAEPDEVTGKRPAKPLTVSYEHVAVFNAGTLSLNLV